MLAFLFDLNWGILELSLLQQLKEADDIATERHDCSDERR